MVTDALRAVFWDFGGVISSSPFAAFSAYEHSHGLPNGFIRSVNAVDPDTNAWARIERGEIDADEFDRRFAEESGRLGHSLSGREVLSLIYGSLRPRMVAALDAVAAAGLINACLTNNVRSLQGRPGLAEVIARFDHVIESVTLGFRKPEPEFYERACTAAGVAASDVVFLDDLGINLKPARAMGMTTIKVVDPDDALDELGDLLGLAL